MTSLRSLRLAGGLLLVVLGTSLSARSTGAAICGVKFTLPFEAKWGRAVLPAGEYSFRLNSLSEPFTVRGQRGDAVALILGRGTSAAAQTGGAYLVLVRQGAMWAIRELHLPEFGIVMDFNLSKPHGMMLAKGPYLIQRIPLSTAGT